MIYLNILNLMEHKITKLLIALSQGKGNLNQGLNAI